MEAKVRIYTDYWIDVEDGDSDEDLVAKAYEKQNKEMESGWFVFDDAIVVERR